jgi:hypothetical protein
MWPKNFADRLESWNHLRLQASTADIDSALTLINTWWFNIPWKAYHLHWDDCDNWPDPWQLLSDDMYCPRARGLGILYTITIIDRADLQDCMLIECGSDNLVLIPQEKYILNWDQEQIVNIIPGSRHSLHNISQSKLKQQIR